MNFLFDNNMSPPLALAFRALGKSVAHVRDFPGELGLKPSDPLIMEFASSRGFLVVSRDLAQAKEPWFKPSLLSHRAGYYLYRTAHAKGKEPPAWEIAKLLVKAWDDVERYSRDNKAPFLALIRPNGHVTSY